MPPSADDFVLTAVHVRGEGWTVTVADPQARPPGPAAFPCPRRDAQRGPGLMRMEIARALRVDPARVSVFVMTQRDERERA